MTAMARRVLVVEDDHRTNETIRLYLERDGFDVVSRFDGPSAIDEMRTNTADLVILDLMLPGINGLEVCRAIGRESKAPIIMLTARSTEDDKLLGLDSGADDYLTKPFSPRELMARVRAVLRRTSEEKRPGEIAFAGIVIDHERHQISVDGKPIELTPTEMRILSILARSPGRVFSRGELITKALGGDSDVFERTVDAHITNLRRKLRAAGRTDLVNTVFGAGYRMAKHP
ncbi:MAG: response regulator [Thermoanaerobaculia bacterium]